jgi:hypothetical protein
MTQHHPSSMSCSGYGHEKRREREDAGRRREEGENFFVHNGAKFSTLQPSAAVCVLLPPSRTLRIYNVETNSLGGREQSGWSNQPAQLKVKGGTWGCETTKKIFFEGKLVVKFKNSVNGRWSLPHHLTSCLTLTPFPFAIYSRLQDTTEPHSRSRYSLSSALTCSSSSTWA